MNAINFFKSIAAMTVGLFTQRKIVGEFDCSEFSLSGYQSKTEVKGSVSPNHPDVVTWEFRLNEADNIPRTRQQRIEYHDRLGNEMWEKYAANKPPRMTRTRTGAAVDWS